MPSLRYRYISSTTASQEFRKPRPLPLDILLQFAGFSFSLLSEYVIMTTILHTAFVLSIVLNMQLSSSSRQRMTAPELEPTLCLS